MIRFSSLLVMCAVLVSAQSPESRRAQPVDGFAAEVDGTIITVGDVVQRIRPELMALRGQMQGEALLKEQTRVFQEGLDKLIDDQLMLAKFRKLGAELPEGVVRERADLVMRQRFANDRTLFQQALSAAGKTEQQWREELKEQLIIQSMVQQFVRAAVHLSPREVREAYEERKESFERSVELELSAITFRPDADGNNELRQRKIEEVRSRVEQGESFADLARVFSEGPKANQGGYQGWVNLNTLPAELREALQDLQVGDRSGLIDTPVQSYFFEVTGRRGGGLLSLPEVQPELERELREQKQEETYQAWVKGLREEFQIQRFNPDISAVTGEL